MRLIVSLLVLLIVLPGQAQIAIGRQVIGSMSLNGSTSVGQVSSTVGELAVQRLNSSNFTLTQGFEQPSIQPFLVEINISYPDCWNGANAVLNFTQLSGCGEEYDVVLQNDEGSAEALDALAAGTYALTITASGGCVFESNITVEEPMIEPCDLVVYNVITPNTDGHNDTWWIEGIELDAYAQNEVKVFNRWGQLVWSTSNYRNETNAFTGADRDGNKLPEGVYMYEISWDSNVITGTVNLLQ